MLRSIWFFIQIAIIVVAIIWLARMPGSMVVEIMEYKITSSVGLFLVALLFFISFVLILHKLFTAITAIPGNLSAKKRETRKTKGYEALTKGLVAIAAGDSRQADKFARMATKLLPDDTGLPILLEAQAAKLRGEEEKAIKSFNKLLENKDTAFLGVRGLLKTALDQGDKKTALIYARKALELHPDTGWILQEVYNLELRNGNWHQAKRILEKAVKSGAITKKQAEKDVPALLFMIAKQYEAEGKDKEAIKKYKKACDSDISFLPAGIRLAKKYMENRQRRKAVPLIEKIWKVAPHPELEKMWRTLAPQSKASDPAKRMKWFERLLALKPDSVEGQLVAAQAAIDEGLWGEARAYLNAASRIRQIARMYYLYADIEEKTGGDQTAISNWIERASFAPEDKAWICTKTGYVYDEWKPIAEPHGFFNTIVWDYPRFPEPAGTISITDSTATDPLMIEKVQ